MLFRSLDEVEETEGSSIEDVSVSRDGRAVVASAEADTETLVESHSEALFGQAERRQPTPPQVSFGIERTADCRVRVTHEGRDAVERPLLISSTPSSPTAPREPPTRSGSTRPSGRATST